MTVETGVAGSVTIRTDASLSIGTGHVMRCLTLAEALRERGARVRFICRNHEGNLVGLIEARGFAVCMLPPGKESGLAAGAPAHAAWLGASWEEDASQTRAAIAAAHADDAGAQPEWLVVDHYALDVRWEQELRGSARKLMVIDDLADRVHDCDLLLDQNLVREMTVRYTGKVPWKAGMLIGPGYALLRPDYAEFHRRARVRQGEPRRILIYFGGVDSENLTGEAVSAFLSLNRSDLDADVVVGNGTALADSAGRLAVGAGNIRFHAALPSLAPLMENADLAIGASGATSWERLCLGLPALVVAVADNQRPIAEELDKRGLIRLLGSEREVDATAIAKALKDVIRQGLDGEWSARCLSAVDGLGTQRVCAALMTTAETSLAARDARLEDEDLLLDWTNDPETRRNAFSSDPILPAPHSKWFRDRLASNGSCRFFIVETTDEVPLGQVRFERTQHEWEVHYSLAQPYRGRGLGRGLLASALSKLGQMEPEAVVFGRVKSENQASRRIFESLGFGREVGAGDDVVVYRLRL